MGYPDSNSGEHCSNYERSQTPLIVGNFVPCNTGVTVQQHSSSYFTVSSTYKPRPHIVCLCGSTRFRELYRKVNAAETMAGYIVLSVGCFAGDPEWGTNKVNLDELHKRKIDLADEVVVLTLDNYIGASTRSEIDYATAQGKPLRYINETT